MLPMKKSPPRVAADSTASDSAMCERAALANTMPSPISSANAIIFLRSVARVSGGNWPARGTAFSSATNRFMSAKGLPAVRPSRSSAGAWLTPMPKRNRPFDASWMKLAVLAKSCTWRV